MQIELIFKVRCKYKPKQLKGMWAFTIFVGSNNMYEEFFQFFKK